MSTSVETIKNFMSALTNYAHYDSQIGRIALDDAVRQSTTYSSLEEVVKDLKNKLADTETYPDTDTRLKEATGIVIGAENDYNADTGAITGFNAGGSSIKNAADIVPEYGDMSSATLPTPGSTTPITYTGNDGKSFTFYVKWPDSFTTVVDCESSEDDGEELLYDSRYQVDLNTLDENGYYLIEDKLSDDLVFKKTSPTFGQMKSAIQTTLKGLNTWWLREAAKLDYDSLGLALDGQTIEIKFIARGKIDGASAVTYLRREDSLPANFITLAININNNGRMDSNNPNGLVTDETGNILEFLDRVIAHEMVHVVMLSKGMFKRNMPQFFTEGIADLVQGDDDYNSGARDDIKMLVNDSDTLSKALNFESGTGGDYAYTAGDMLMRFIAKQSLNTTAIVGDPNQAQTFDYNGNDEVITNYTEDDTINYNANFVDAGISTSLNDLCIFSDEETGINIRDVRGKLVTFNTSVGNAYAHMSANAGEVDGKNFYDGNNYEILFGANYENNVIRAGNAGSYLWGGLRGNDELFGGTGADTFNYSFDGGKDTIHNAESQDSVILRDITLDAISSVQFTDNGVNAAFTDGGTLNIEGQPSHFSIKYENTTTNYRADYQNKIFIEE
ncbi:MAG: hypothetical protein IKZ58_00525 [Selenomonadaceae bacterium]|nr:hypothetical protein [Selenomonadaceae bacterium]